MKKKERKQIYFGARYDFDDQEISIVKFWGRRKQSIRWDDVVNVSTFQRQHMEFLRISTMDRKFDISDVAVNGEFAELKKHAEQALAYNIEKLRKQPTVKFVYPEHIISDNRKNYLFNTLGIMIILILPLMQSPFKVLNALAHLFVFWNDPSMAEVRCKLIGLLIMTMFLLLIFIFQRRFIAGVTKNVTYVLTNSVIGIERNGEGDIRELEDIVELTMVRNFLQIQFRDGSKLKIYDSLVFFRFFSEKLEAGSKVKIVTKKSFMWVWVIALNVILIIVMFMLRDLK